MNQTGDPLTIKGSIERIALLPLNYTRYNTIIIYEFPFCRTKQSDILILYYSFVLYLYYRNKSIFFLRFYRV